jgi:hypothetical protein
MESDSAKVNPSGTELWNCENAFEFICPRKWVSLRPTESPDIRYCEVCNQNVYLCETPLEFVRQGNLGRCVAIRPEVTPKGAFFDYRKGRLLPGYAKRQKEWWEEVSDLNPTFNKEEIDEIRDRYQLLK